MTSQVFSEKIQEHIGPDKAYSSQAKAATAIGVSKAILSVIIRQKRDSKGRLLYSRASAEEVAKGLEISFDLIPSELRPRSLKEQARRLASPERVAFGRFINDERKAQGLAIAELAEISGIPWRRLVNAMSGTSCTAETAIRLCEALEIDNSMIPECINTVPLDVIHMTLIASLGITTIDELKSALMDARACRSYKRDLAAARRQITHLQGQLFESRRLMSMMRAASNETFENSRRTSLNSVSVPSPVGSG